MTQLLLNLLQIGLALGVPALIAIYAPRRWRMWAIGLWALAPLLVAAAVGVSEIVSGKASATDLDKLVYGLLLIGSFVLVPWLLACGLGFALGAMLRGRVRSEAVAVAPSKPPAEVAKPVAEAPPAPESAPYAPQIDPDFPNLSPPSGWRVAHVGVDHDDLELDGLPVWSLPWREEGGERITLVHPSHPGQLHAFTVYSVDDGARATRFAAAELSNGVWGFYRWVVPVDVASGVSADGSLRFEHDLGRYAGGRYDSTAPLARLRDERSGALLFDGAAWQSSRIVSQTDGSLLLSLEQGDRQTIFRIDPVAGDFRDLATMDGPRPLAELPDAAAAARADCDDPANTYLGRRVAPDGSLVVELASVEWSNTHWVNSPRVIEIATGRVLLDLWGTDWDAWPSFPRRQAVRLSMRRYRGGGAQVELELAPERYILLEGGGATFGPLGELPEALEAASRRAVAAAPPRPTIAPPRPTARSWLVALLILIGTLALIAVATLVSLRLQGEPPPPKLDTIPPMPSIPPTPNRP
ncbi:hypothetical protein [Phenylobacterium sp.]|uniref:hypothetical protein n=1 Tax=Phenylobacterium sp. TaxID=1871053 RepID=UPI002ED90DB4